MVNFDEAPVVTMFGINTHGVNSPISFHHCTSVSGYPLTLWQLFNIIHVKLLVMVVIFWESSLFRQEHENTQQANTEWINLLTNDSFIMKVYSA